MSHDFIGCTDPDCQLCQAYLKGCENTYSVLLYIRNHGIPDGLRWCDTPCDHPRCTLLWTLDFAYRAVEAKAHADGAEAWTTHNPLLASQLRDVVSDDVKDGG